MEYLSRLTELLEDSSDGSVRGRSEVKVLVIEDENMIAQMYHDWLSDAGYSVEVANGGEEALKTVDGGVDVVLLDRRMPVITGDEILDLFRSEDIRDLDPEKFGTDDSYHKTQEYEEKGVEDIDLETVKKLDEGMVRNLQKEDIDCRVCMVTAINPDLDIMELDFDHYVVKNVDKNRLVEIVGALASMSAVDEEVREYQSLRWKRFILKESYRDSKLEENEEYQRLEDRLEEIEEDAGEKVKRMKEIEFK